MNDKLKKALETVKAEEVLKNSTYNFIRDQLANKKKVKIRRWIVAMASFLIILAGSFFSYEGYNKEAVIIDLDVNPSMELKVNGLNRVIGAHAYNKDGEKVLASVDIKNKTDEEALENIINQMEEMGYIKDSSLVTATVQVRKDGKAKKIEKDISSYIKEILSKGSYAAKQETFIIDKETKEKAHGHELTPAKYLAILELNSLDENSNFDNCRDKTIEEIQKESHGHMNKEQKGEKGHNNKHKNHN